MDIHGSDVSLTHISSFKDNATTMDILPSQIADTKHITGDASVYDFVANKLSVKHVLLERLPTASYSVDDAGQQSSSSSAAKQTMHNVIGNCVFQLAKAMETGAVLEIEWEPFVSFNNSTPAKNEANRRANPFQGFMNTQTMINACAYQYVKHRDGSETERVRDLATLYFREHQYLSANGMDGSVSDLVDRAMMEAVLFGQMAYHPGAPMIIPRFNLQTATTSEVNVVLREACVHSSLSGHKTGSEVTVTHPEKPSVQLTGRVIPAPMYFNESYLHYFNSCIAVQLNTPHVIRYLRSVGFRDISVERRTNIHNGRKNVWMVSAKRK
jgi:hypothetical protein